MTEPRKIVLIGTDHKYQKLCPPFQLEHAQDFQRYLLEVCPQYGIKTVAEEMNEQSLEKAKKSWEKFKKDLEGKNNCNRLRAEIWARKEEELKGCLDALKWHKQGRSIPQRVADKLSLKFHFCDPDTDERKRCEIEDIGVLERMRDDNDIPSDEAERRINVSWTKRERYWLEQLQKNVSESKYPVLFICGAKHVNTFSKLLRESGFNVKCICDDWESSIPKESE